LGEERKQTELTQQRIELGWDLSQQALGILVCNFQGTDSNGLQAAQQSLDFSRDSNGVKSQSSIFNFLIDRVRTQAQTA
jgi:hypothetical protein